LTIESLRLSPRLNKQRARARPNWRAAAFQSDGEIFLSMRAATQKGFEHH
jgi:hypothetical protein